MLRACYPRLSEALQFTAMSRAFRSWTIKRPLTCEFAANVAKMSLPHTHALNQTCSIRPYTMQCPARLTQRVAGSPTLARAAVHCKAQPASTPQQQQQQRAQQQHLQQGGQQLKHAGVSRRTLLAASASSLLLLGQPPQPADALVLPPPGYRYHEDKLDGYSFFYPEDWLPVTTSGNDVFYRNPFDVEENLFVNVSSPSSSKYQSVQDLGSLQDAAQRLQQQYLEEFMSTRLGVKRSAEVVSAVDRTGPDGRLYYDIQTEVQSFASRNQLSVSQQEVEAGVVLEWDRRYLTVLGVAGRRLYEFRLQASNRAFEADSSRLLRIAGSFRCRETA